MLVEIGIIDFIILVGGFLCLNFLIDEIKSYFGFFFIKFIFLKDFDKVVLQGVVLFGYYFCVVMVRICRYIYGIGVNEVIDSKIYFFRKCVNIDGDEKCINVFDVLVYKDELVKYDEVRMKNL